MRKLIVSAVVSAFVCALALTSPMEASAADNCSPCNARQQSNAQSACASSFGGKGSDYGASTCTACKDTNRLMVTCWKDNAKKGDLSIKDLATPAPMPK